MRRAWLGVAALALAGTAQARRFDVMAQGGVGQFTGGLVQFTETGPTWGVSVNADVYRALQVELGYQGSFNVLNGVDDDAPAPPALVRHGGEMLVRVSPRALPEVRPFVGAGLGLSQLSVAGALPGFRADVLEELPLAAGVDFRSGALHLGLRTTFRVLFGEGFADVGLPASPQGGRWDVGATAGGRF
ncbi:MAG: hypothetical protein ACOZIN_12595 [Myxococcota bacterium]